MKKPPFEGISLLSRSHSRNCAWNYSGTSASDGVISRERGVEAAEGKSSLCIEIRSYDGYAVEASPILSITMDCDNGATPFRSMAILT